MPKTAFYQFDGGINYRDDVIAINELRDANNLYWRGNLKRRAGYEYRNAQLASPTGGAGTTWPSSGLQIMDHIRLECASGSDQTFLFVYMADTAAATNVIAAYYCSGIPNATSEVYTIVATSTYTTAGNGEIIPWSTSDPLEVAVHNDKVWMALGDDNPYIMFNDTSTGGAVWRIREYPLCSITNNLSTEGSTTIINPTTDTGNAGWNGTKIVAANDKFVYVSDGKALFYGITELNARADLWSTMSTIVDRASGIDAGDDVYTPGWAADQFTGIEEGMNIEHAIAYNKYLFLYGEKGLISFYLQYQ